MKHWKLEGYDTFEGAYYPLEGEFESKEAAEAAADDQLKKLEQEQPTASSGGQASDGIQDRVYVVRPDGGKYRYMPLTFTRAEVVAKDAGDLLIRRADGKGENLPPPMPGVQVGEKGFVLELGGLKAFIAPPRP